MPFRPNEVLLVYSYKLNVPKHNTKNPEGQLSISYLSGFFVTSTFSKADNFQLSFFKQLK